MFPGMDAIETFARRVPAISRRRVLQVLATSVAVTQVGRLNGGTARAQAATPAWQPPPPYDAIVGLL